MKIKKWKEINHKEKGIILFTILSILLIVGVFFYQSFAIFKANTNQDLIEGNVENIGDLEFAFYIDNQLADKAPEKDKGYSLDTSSSYCKDMKTGERITRVSWDSERWGPYFNNISTTKTKCFLYFKQIYEETELNGAVPDLMNGRLVPVKISESAKPSDISYAGAVAGKVTKANITDTSDPWYKYADKKWANAVILKDGVEDTYQPGEEIYEGDIESYFVWIPRYKYKLKKTEEEFNKYTELTAKEQQANIASFYSAIGGNKATNSVYEITFESKNTPVTTTGEYRTHPAFIAFDANGLWVGKFETGYNQNADPSNVTPTNSWSTGGAQKNEQESNKVIIKPNVYSWRSIQVGKAFYTSYEYKRDLESHMMKNTEWGAVAYLTQSQYGRCNDSTCDEVSINNEASYITGWSTVLAPTCGYTESIESCNYYGGPTVLTELNSGNLYSYYKTESKDGSTTGNYTGIYDMSGGAWEYVMGVLQSGENNNNPTSGKSKTYNSGFNGTYSCYHCDGTAEETLTGGYEWPSSKYYDLYDYKESNQQYQRGIFGDATKEVGPFYSVSYLKPSNSNYGPERHVSSYNADLALFVSSDFPWFARGGSRRDGTGAGMFAFDCDRGLADGLSGFRVVLAS